MRILFPMEPRAFRRFPKSVQRLGIMALSSSLKQEGFRVGLAKATVKDLSETLSDGEPTILAYSMVSQLADPMLDMNREIKQRFDVKSFLGGAHATYYPEVINEAGVDGICIGEGDIAMVDMAKRIRDGQDYSDTLNWHINTNGRTVKNPLRPLVQDMDSLPFVDRSIMPRTDINSIMTSRGCPYNCTYCLNAAYNRLYDNKSARIRQRSVDNVIEELRQIKQYAPHTFIAFLDTILALKKDWTEEFAEKYRKHIGLPFFCNIKFEVTDREVIGMLKNAGCYSIGVGIESADETVRRELMRRKVANSHIIDVCKWIDEAGIRLHTFNILGMPKTNFADDIETMKFNIQIKSDFAEATVLSPYRGSEIHDMVKRWGLLSDHAGYERSTFTIQTINYDSPRTLRKLVNLESLYPFMTRYPFLVKHADTLTDLNLKWLYSKLFSLWIMFVYRGVLFPPFWLRRIKTFFGRG